MRLQVVARLELTSGTPATSGSPSFKNDVLSPASIVLKSQSYATGESRVPWAVHGVAQAFQRTACLWLSERRVFPRDSLRRKPEAIQT